jgi:hypothetical protein
MALCVTFHQENRLIIVKAKKNKNKDPHRERERERESKNCIHGSPILVFS